MLAMQVESERLLVIRETGAPLPKLDELPQTGAALMRDRGNGFSPLSAHENVTVISQFADEGLSLFAERVKSRVERDLASGVVYRGAILASSSERLTGEATMASHAERAELVHYLARVLARGPNGWLQIQVQNHDGGFSPNGWLTLMESAARGAPHLDVRIAFSRKGRERSAKNASKVSSTYIKASAVPEAKLTRFRNWTGSSA